MPNNIIDSIQLSGTTYQIQGGGSSYTAGDGIDITNDVISVTGKADTSAVTEVSDALTAHTANTIVHTTAAEKTSWNGAVTDIATVSGQVSTNTANIATVSAATTANTTALGGLSLIKLTQAEYDALVTKDNSTLYVIVD